MIKLIDGQNTIYPTLQEKTTIVPPSYYVIFINDNTAKKVGMYLTDTSTNVNRNNKFSINVSVTGDIAFDDYGSYHCYFYEYSGTPPVNMNTVDTLDIRTLTGLVEDDIMKYVKTPSSIPYYKDLRSSIKTYGT